MQFGQSNWVKSDLGRNRPIPIESSDREVGKLGGSGGQVAWIALSETKTKTRN